MNKMMTKARKGATFIEYAMLAGLVAIVVAVAAMFFGDQLTALFTETGNQTKSVAERVKGVDLKAKGDSSKTTTPASSGTSTGTGS